MFGGRCHILLLFLLPAAGLLAGGCQREPLPPAEDEIRFLVDDEWHSGDGAATKAVLFEEGALSTGGSFKVDAYLAGTAGKYIDADIASYKTETSDWRFDDDYYWPMAPSTLDFMAWMPTNLSNTYVSAPTRAAGTSPTFVCSSLPLSSSGQSTLQEFVYAWKPGQSKANPGAAGVTLAFKHPFARLQFQVTTAHQLLHINTVKFLGIKHSGTYHHNAPEASTPVASAWTDLSGSGNLTIDINSDIAAGAVFTDSQLTSFGLPFLVIPQTYTPTDQIEVNLEWPKGTAARTVVITNPISEWQPGKSYTYTLDLSDPIRFGVVVADWATGTVYNQIIFSLTAEGWVDDTTNSKDLDFGS